MQKYSFQIHLVLNNAQIQRPQGNNEVSLEFVSQETAPIIFLFYRQGNKPNTVNDNVTALFVRSYKVKSTD